MAKKIVEKKSVKKVAPIAETLPKLAEQEVKEVIAEVEAAAPKARKETEEEKTARLIQSVVRAVMTETVPAMMALQQGNQSSAGLKPVRRMIQCRECKQAGPKAPPCNGEHIKMVVYPNKYPEFGKWFQGSIINGIRYLSDRRNQAILVPAACEGQIVKQIADFEENERVTRMGRSAEEPHNSGEIRETGGGKINHAVSAWR